MKKHILLIMMLFLLTGCMKINDAKIPDIIKEVQTSKLVLANQSRNGYKYYLPTHLNLKETIKTNEIFLSGNYAYYMYIDLVSYHEKVPFTYELSPSSYLSMDISDDRSVGYLEVNVKQNKYLIEIMYNYAKIEVIVDQNYLKEAITNALIILSTIKYNDDIINNLMGNDVLSLGEETLNIFDTNRGESNFLQDIKDSDVYEGADGLPDRDKIN